MFYLTGTSRLLNKPLAGLVMGQSSAGKSYVIKTVAKLFPDEVKLDAHRITPRALEHMEPGSLVHCFVVAGERSRKQDDDTAETTRALREMISDGKLTLLITIKDSQGNHRTSHIVQDGPIAYIESTTLGIQEIFNEDRTRFVLLCSDESKEQTQAVIDKILDNVCMELNIDMQDTIIALHHTAQRLLKPYNVVIPFAGQLRYALPVDKIETRRTIGHLVSFIQAVTLLHQFQRQEDSQGRLIATIEDYNIVRKYLTAPLARSLGRSLTPGAEELMDFLAGKESFTVADIANKTNIHYNTALGRVKELRSAGQIEMVEQASGRKGAEYKVSLLPRQMNGLILPEIKEEL